ncbi:MAG TPA: toxin [Acidimicrobiaceae bacterium]|nr:toxin [Acidimicrobiaceae bacterium]
MRPQWGEVWWCDTVTAGRRPCVVLSRNAAISRLDKVLVVPATTTVRGLESEVELDPDHDAVPRWCVLNLDTPEVLPRSAFSERVGSLSFDRMQQVCRALAAAVDCR